MEPLDSVTVYKVTDPTHAEIIKSALASEGIHCDLGGENQGGFSGIWEIEVMVRAIDADRAKKIIESHEPGRDG